MPESINTARFQKFFRETIRVSKGLGPNQARQFVMPDLCLSFAKVISRQQKLPPGGGGSLGIIRLDISCEFLLAVS